MDLYRNVLDRLQRDRLLGLDDSVLVVCGGTFDIQTLRALHFSNVTISNLDTRYDEQAKPYGWSRQDAESLTFPDASFDWAFVHAGLHHCASPHKALLEMCRVSRKGVVVVEARDSALMRLAVRLGFTDDHEINDGITGGVANGPIPNFIYRWTEREVMKVIESAYPHRVNDVRFFYGMRFPSLPMRGIRKVALGAAWAAARALQGLAPRQCNSFAFAIRHTSALKPWMTADGRSVRRDWKR